MPLPCSAWVLYRCAALHTSACLLEAVLPLAMALSLLVYFDAALHLGYKTRWILNPLSLPYHLACYPSWETDARPRSLHSSVRAICIWSCPSGCSPVFLYPCWYGSASSKSPMSVLNTFLDTLERPQWVSYKSNNLPGPSLTTLKLFCLTKAF